MQSNISLQWTSLRAATEAERWARHESNTIHRLIEVGLTSEKEVVAKDGFA